ncbi:hypothetical protein [Streptomyces finlayi]|nr:hypothetical protein [Streptomyces finlayi]
MTFLENILAGLVVAVLSWCVHRVRTRWAAPRRLSTKRGTLAMGKRIHPYRDDLPMGPHRELAELLIKLYNEWCPGYLEVAERASISTGSVTNVLKGLALVSKPVTMSAANVLALGAVRTRPHLNAEGADEALTAYTRKIQDLYERAVGEETDAPAVNGAHELWDEIVRRPWDSVLTGRLTSDVLEAMQRSSLETVSVDPYDRGVVLVIGVPDVLALYAFDEGVGPMDSTRSWEDEFADELGRRLRMVLRVRTFISENYDVEVEEDGRGK